MTSHFLKKGSTMFAVMLFSEIMSCAAIRWFSEVELCKLVIP